MNLIAINPGVLYVERAKHLFAADDFVAHATNGARTDCYEPVELHAGEICRVDSLTRRSGVRMCGKCFPDECMDCGSPALSRMPCFACMIADTVQEKRRAA